MWLFTIYGFFSVACAKDDDSLLMIRARNIQHLENLRLRFAALSGCTTETKKNTDYPHRMFVHKDVWQQVVSLLVAEQHWSNFKDQATKMIPEEDDGYIQALHSVWSLMLGYQMDEEEKKRQKKEGYKFGAPRHYYPSRTQW